MNADDLLSKLDDNYTLRLLEDMIRIPSVVGQEGELAEYLREELGSLGLETELDEVEPGRPNAYARLKGDEPGRRLHFNGHTDTVPVAEGWDTDPFSPVRKEGRLHGLGSCDMKAGLACILTMLKAFKESGYGFKGELSFSGVIDEEAYGEGAKALLRTDYADVGAIVLAEPYPGDETKPIPLGLTGKVLYDVHVHGKAAHGFRPHLGVNAVEEAGNIIANLDKLSFEDHPHFGKGNYCTLKIEGGYEVYSVVIPAKCRFEVNRLLVPGETVQSVIGDMERLVESLGLESEVEVKTKPPRYEPFSLDRSEPIIQVFDEVYRNVLGSEPLYEYAYGITDANIFAGEGGIPCLHFGPRRGGAHQKNEYVPLDWLPKVSKVFTLVAANFLNLQ